MDDARTELEMKYYDRHEVGTRIKKIRRIRGLTQNELAERLDYATERQLQRIENGETACSVDKLMEIAQLLEVSTDFILFGSIKDKKGEYAKYFEGKTENQTKYLTMLLEVAGKNLELLYQ